MLQIDLGSELISYIVRSIQIL